MSYKSKGIEEDSRSSEGIGELEEEGFYSFREEENCSVHQTWSPFEDFDDSGHFTASPDGETALSGSSRSHSPCFLSTAHSQMQHPTTLSFDKSQQTQSQGHPLQDTNKPLISPRSVMTVKVPHTASVHLENNCNDMNTRHLTNQRRPATFCVASQTLGESCPVMSKSCTDVSNHNLLDENDKMSEEGSTYLQGIVENFNSLYMEKLRMLDDLVTEGNQEQRMLLMERKTNMLETWAKDVCVQNMVLVHTVEELEKEANRKVCALQTKIAESTQAAKEHMSMIKKYEEQVKVLLKNQNDNEGKNLVLKIDLEKLRNECKRVKEKMNFLLRDNESLITLVCRIRDMGVWDVQGLELQRSSLDQIFGLYPRLAGSEVQTVFSTDRARREQDSEEKILLLEKQLSQLSLSQQNVDSEILQKDKKIEELEMQIKNISNRAHYCEQECNDYKKSLLETQEKLLEATRRLNSSPKLVKPSTPPGMSEMTQLIKELRDVKSQLNMAVDEKQTAKEESNFFKRELSQRLKELHDIQNVFQNLTAEVVNSRMAFQQVQEKEVQLESLKSEMQTYQARCTDAEDTIRRKETEIKALQHKMNLVHKTSKKCLAPNTPRSENTQAISEITGISTCKSSSRCIKSPSRIPVAKSHTKFRKNPSEGRSLGRISVTQPQLSNSKTRGSSVSSNSRPAWKFGTKNYASESHSWKFTELPKVPRHIPKSAPRLGGILLSTAQYMDEIDKGMGDYCRTNLHMKEKLKEIRCKTTCEGNLHYFSTRSKSHMSIIKEDPSSLAQKTNFLPNVPKEMKEKGSHQTHLQPVTNEIAKTAETKLETIVEQEKLPVVTGNVIPNGIKSLRLKTPTHNTPRLNELINAVVETSKQLLGSEDSRVKKHSVTPMPNRKKKFKLPKRPSTETDLRRVKSSDVNAEVSRGATADAAEPRIPSKFYSSIGLTQNIKDSPEDAISEYYASPRAVHDFLAGLPQSSQEDLVTNWINKSSKNDSSSKEKGTKVQKSSPRKSPVLSGRRPSIRMVTNLATRRSLRKNYQPDDDDLSTEQLKAEVSAMKEKMFELEDEWGKVFANIEGNKGPEVKETVDKVVSSNGRMLPCLSSPSNPSSSRGSISSTNESECGVDKCCDKEVQHEESIQALLDRLAKEKQEVEERFRREQEEMRTRFQKEIQDKDVELKMQKVTIQHLQDAYVALKRGQPIPVPQNITGNKIVANGATSTASTSNGFHHNSVLDV